jgi:hypothetical protein
MGWRWALSLTLALASCTAAARGKVSVSTCCEAVRGGDEACGAGGLGFRFDEGAWGLFRGEEAREAALRGVQLAPAGAAAVALVGALSALGGARGGAWLVLLCAALAPSLFWVSLALERTLLGLRPLGWLRVANVFNLHLYAVEALHSRLADAERRCAAEVAIFSLLGLSTLAQEKLLWRVELSVGVPVACTLLALALERAVGLRIAGPVAALAGAAVVLTAAPIVSLDAPTAVPQPRWEPSQRLFWSAAWPLVGLPLCAALRAGTAWRGAAQRAAGVAALTLVAAAVLVALAILAPTQDDWRFAAPNNGRFCCLSGRKLGSGESYYDCAEPARNWFVRWDPPFKEWDREVWLMWVVTVLTNASGLPASAFAFSLGEGYVGVVGVLTVVFSTMYHLADTADRTVLGLSEGSWHRLDNIFAILAFCNLAAFCMLADPLVEPARRETTRAALVLFTVLCQEIGPWQLVFTLVPIAAAALVGAHHLWRTPPLRAALRRDKGGNLRPALMLALAGVAGFIKGLDDENDYLRVAHGAWHLLTGFAFLFFARWLHAALQDASEVSQHKDS